MPKVQILVAESENIAGPDVQSRLRKLGYGAITASTGEEAIRLAEDVHPDIVLIDFKLSGEMNGAKTAEHLYSRFNLPVIFLADPANKTMLVQTTQTQLFSYLLRPIEEEALHKAIEMALRVHNTDKKFRDSKQWLATTLQNIGEGVIATDSQGTIKLMNPVAEMLTGWMQEEALGKDSATIVQLVDIQSKKKRNSLIHKVLTNKKPVFLSGYNSLIAKDGTETPIDCNAAPIFNDAGETLGVILVLRDISERHWVETIEHKQREQAEAQAQALKTRERYLTLLNNITETALKISDLETMLQILARQMGEMFAADRCHIVLNEDDLQFPHLVTTYDKAHKMYSSRPIEPGELTMTATVLYNRHALIIEDVGNSPYVTSKDANQLPAQSLICLPLIANDQKLGAVLITYRQKHQFTTQEIAWGEQAGRQIALAVAKARLLKKEQEQRLLAQTSREVTLALTAQTNHKAVLDEILRQSQRIVPYITANIALLKDDDLHIVQRKGYRQSRTGPPDAVLIQKLNNFPLDAEVLRTQKPLAIFDTEHEPRWVKNSETPWIRSHIAVPICHRQQVLGLLRMDGDTPGQFTARDAQHLEPLANAAAIALENARLYEQALQDSETKLTLLNEVNHRVKNNLAAIVGLLYAEQNYGQTNNGASPQNHITDLINRVQGLATVHNILSAGEWTPVLLSELSEQIIRSALQALPADKRASVKVSPSPIKIAPAQASNLALAINELTTNSAKHASSIASGVVKISVDITADEQEIQIKFKDNGPGYPEGILAEDDRCYNVGFDLIQNVVKRNLHGDMTLYNDNGAVTVIHFTPQ